MASLFARVLLKDQGTKPGPTLKTAKSRLGSSQQEQEDQRKKLDPGLGLAVS